jgi:predicted enzyme related to lactoylglutathione lyase
MHRLSLVILAVADLPRSIDFYSRSFGWPQTVNAPVYAEFVTPGSLRVGLYLREGYVRNFDARAVSCRPNGGVTATELYFECDDVHDLLARLTAAGAQLLSAPAERSGGDLCAYVADPDGNVLAVAQKRAGVRG